MRYKNWKVQFISEELFSVLVAVVSAYTSYNMMFFLSLMLIFGIVPRRAFRSFIREVEIKN